MQSKITLLALAVFSVGALAQNGTYMNGMPVQIDFPAPQPARVQSKEEIECLKVVREMAKKYGVGSNTWNCNDRRSSIQFLKIKDGVPACIEGLLQVTSDSWDSIQRCSSDKMREEMSDEDFIKCAMNFKKIGMGRESISICRDQSIMRVQKRAEYFPCIDTLRSTLPHRSLWEHAHACREPKYLSINSAEMKTCVKAINEMDGNKETAQKFCFESENQKPNNLRKVKDCVVPLRPIVGKHMALKYCTTPNVNREIAPAISACISKTMTFLEDNYFEKEDWNRVNTLAVLKGFVEECKEDKRSSDLPSGIGFVGAKIFANASFVDKSPLGGLSGLSYDASANKLWIVSDDNGLRDRTRYFGFDLDFSKGFKLTAESVNYLNTRSKGEGILSFSQQENIDAEGIVATPDNHVIVSSETLLRNSKSFHKIYDENDDQVGEIILNEKFLPVVKDVERKVKDQPQHWDEFEIWENGRRVDRGRRQGGNSMRTIVERQQVQGVFENRGFEALTGSKDATVLYTANEYPLVQDNFTNKQFVRIVKLELKKDGYETTSEFAYEIEFSQQSENGLVDLAVLNEKTLLVLERQFSQFQQKVISRIFEVDLTSGQDYKDVFAFQKEESEQRPIKTLKKKLVLDLEDVLTQLPKGLRKIDNFEGMALGPKLPNGNRSLILTSDNNFRATQFTQVIVLELKK